MSFIDMLRRHGTHSVPYSDNSCQNRNTRGASYSSTVSGAESVQALLSLNARYSSRDEEETEGYSEIFDPPLDNKYECPICLLGLRVPVQTVCGHRFCHACILRSLRDSGLRCPVDQEPLEKHQLFPDKFTEREILQFIVLCRHVKKGCPWKGMLQEMKNHLVECGYEEIKCPNNCGTVVERKDFEIHLKDECPERLIECPYCHLKILFKKKIDHEEGCPNYPEECPNNCSDIPIPRQKLKHHLETECPKQQVDCPFHGVGCTFTGLKEELQLHLENFNQSHIVDLATAVSSLLGKHKSGGVYSGDSMFDRVHKLEELVEKVKRDTQIQKDHAESLYDLCKNLQEKNTQAVTSLAAFEQDMHDKFGRYERLIQELSNKCAIMERKVQEQEGRSCNGLFYWKIKDFNQSRENAIRGINTAIHSPPFHTSFYGYKMCVRSNLNGVDSGFGTHISLFIHMMKGEWDDLLDWPFQGRIVLTIIDQSTNVDFKMHASETLHARPNLVAFNKPTAHRSLKGYGYVEFLPLQNLNERSYVKDDTMIIKVQVFPAGV